MNRRLEYRAQLRRARYSTRFLRRHSGLPGPRANLELLHAAADVGDVRVYREWLRTGEGEDPADEFVIMCGIVGLGQLLSGGRSRRIEQELQGYACDERWRVREAVAIGLQRVGETDMNALFAIIESWLTARPFVQRAAMVAVCEPRLLRPAAAATALSLLDRVTASLRTAPDRGSDEFRVLRQALGYCWSVAAAADPEQGKRALVRWAASRDADVRWVVRENLRKHRLKVMDRAWMAKMVKTLGSL